MKRERDLVFSRPGRSIFGWMNITGTFTPLVRIEETIVPD